MEDAERVSRFFHRTFVAIASRVGGAILEGKPVGLGFHTVKLTVGEDYRDWEEVVEFDKKIEDRTGDACAVVIFGASGDLTRRKLMPALYNLAVGRALPGGFAVVGGASIAATSGAIAAAIQQQAPTPLTALRSGVPLDLDHVVARALADRRSRRRKVSNWSPWPIFFPSAWNSASRRSAPRIPIR